MPAITIVAETLRLLENAHAIVDAALEGGKVHVIDAVLVASAVPEVIDLDTFKPRFYTCALERFLPSQFCVVLAFPTFH